MSDAATLRIDMGCTHPVSPYIFGHNLEHTRACVYGGLSAQLLKNRKFAGRPARRLGVAADWFAIGKRAFFRNDRDPYVTHVRENGMRRNNELNAQTIQNPISGQECGIGQAGLSFRADRGYELAVTARCSVPVDLSVELCDGEGVCAREILCFDADEYTRRTAVLRPDRTTESGCIRLTFSEKARVIVGCVSLLPQGHFRGMRRDVIDRLREMHVGILRWPGGNFAGEYRWQDMFLPVDQRAPIQAVTEIETQPYSHGYDMHEIDTDDFIALCREIGAEPFITVNLAWDPPQECAGWVEYCNGAPDTTYGKKRAERGHPEPYNVRFWSLGNEMGYGHMEGPMEPESYAAMGLDAAKAMLAVSGDLIICSSGPYGASETGQRWIRGSAMRLRDAAPFISYHTYSNINSDYTTDAGIRKTYDEVIAAAEHNRESLKAMRAVTPEGIHISYDEWNLWAAWYSRPSSMDGLFAAKMLHTMLLNAADLDMPIMCYFQPVGEGAIDVLPESAVLTSAGKAFAMIGAHRGGMLCAVEGLSGAEAAATRHGGDVYVTLINDAYDEEKTFALTGPGRLKEVTALQAADLLPGSDLEKCAAEAAAAAGETRLTLPPRSIALAVFAPADEE